MSDLTLEPTTFDVYRGTVRVGSIERYRWNDGMSTSSVLRWCARTDNGYKDRFLSREDALDWIREQVRLIPPRRDGIVR